MKYKPIDEELIAYLYSELSQEETERIESYLEENPEERKQLETLQETRMLMGDLEDEELPEQMAFVNPIKNEEWHYWRKYVAIAATLLLIISFGWISGFKVINGENGTSIGFGETQMGLTEDQVADLIYEDRIQLLEAVNDNLSIRNDSINQKFNAIQASLNNDDRIQQTFEAEKEALLNDISNLTEKLGDDYRDILREIVVSFSNNLEAQRIEDLRNIQAAFDSFEDASINRRMDVEDALYSLSERINTVAASLSNNK